MFAERGSYNAFAGDLFVDPVRNLLDFLQCPPVFTALSNSFGDCERLVLIRLFRRDPTLSAVLVAKTSRFLSAGAKPRRFLCVWNYFARVSRRYFARLLPTSYLAELD